MTEFTVRLDHLALQLLWISLTLAAGATAVVIAGRIGIAWDEAQQRRLRRLYAPLLDRAIKGDADARRRIGDCPPRHRLPIARQLIGPMLLAEDPTQVAAVRAVARAMPLVAMADRWLRSWRWWRRTAALRALGMAQLTERTSQVVAALDDPNAEVRNAALDALADMQDPAALPAIVVRLQDESLQLGRRAAVLAAYGARGEEFLIELADVDRGNLRFYARALEICGTARSRDTLCVWATDDRASVRAAAFHALARIRVDARAAACAIAGLRDKDGAVRAAAAAALQGWTGTPDAAPHLARHLDDVWAVAVRSARTLQSMGPAGRAALEAHSTRADLPGVLAREMLWQPGGHA